MAKDAVGRAGAGVHGDHHRDVAAGLQHFGVPAPGVVIDPGAVGIEQVGDQGVEGPVFAGTVAVDNDNFGGAGLLATSDGGVDFFGVETAAFFVEGGAAVDLIPGDDATDAFHVGHDEYAHG